MTHDHQHSNHRDRDMRRLGLTLVLVVAYMVAEVVGGFLANSLALLADAGHMLSDAASLGLALAAMWIARRPRTASHTFGYHRAEILAALANGAALVAISVLIVREAWERLQSPPDVRGPLMLAVGAGGLVVNLLAVRLLAGGRGRSLNMRGAWLHVVTDTLGSLQVLVAGGLVWAYGWRLVDPLASVVIALLVVWSAWSLLRESVNVLLEAAPAHLDTREIDDALRSVQGVIDLHDLHVWTITSGFVALSVHLIAAQDASSDMLWTVRDLLEERFAIEHSTIQIETSSGGNRRQRPGQLPVLNS